MDREAFEAIQMRKLLADAGMFERHGMLHQSFRDGTCLQIRLKEHGQGVESRLLNAQGEAFPDARSRWSTCSPLIMMGWQSSESPVWKWLAFRGLDTAAA